MQTLNPFHTLSLPGLSYLWQPLLLHLAYILAFKLSILSEFKLRKLCTNWNSINVSNDDIPGVLYLLGSWLCNAFIKVNYVSISTLVTSSVEKHFQYGSLQMQQIEKKASLITNEEISKKDTVLREAIVKWKTASSHVVLFHVTVFFLEVSSPLYSFFLFGSFVRVVLSYWVKTLPCI